MHTINEPLSLVDIQKSYINVLLQELGYLQLIELSNQSVSLRYFTYLGKSVWVPSHFSKIMYVSCLEAVV